VGVADGDSVATGDALGVADSPPRIGLGDADGLVAVSDSVALVVVLVVDLVLPDVVLVDFVLVDFVLVDFVLVDFVLVDLVLPDLVLPDVDPELEPPEEEPPEEEPPDEPESCLASHSLYPVALPHSVHGIHWPSA
jgi:hypothetical protein